MLYVHSLDVFEPYRRKGIGSKLLSLMLNYADENDLVKTFLITNKSNEKAYGLYSKLNGKTMYEDDVVFEWKK